MEGTEKEMGKLFCFEMAINDNKCEFCAYKVFTIDNSKNFKH